MKLEDLGRRLRPAGTRAGADVVRAPGTPVRRSLERFRVALERQAAVRVSDALLRGFSATARRFLPLADEGRQRIEVIRDLRYLPGGSPDHRLDVYRPSARPGSVPIVFYVHGGGFSTLSKETHWMMGMMFARQGHVVFNIGYRLAPRHPYPAALVDTLAAYEWVVRNAGTFGGDLDRLVVAGESAGANLVTALSIAVAYRRPEPWATRAFDLGVAPRVAVPFCGIFQVSDVERFWRRRRMSRLVQLLVSEVAAGYLSRADGTGLGGLELADPLLVLERGEPPERPLPAFFLPVGTRDPLLDDSRRMHRALTALGVPCRAAYYEGEPHAFQAFLVRAAARRCWIDAFGFIDQHVWTGAAMRPRAHPGAGDPRAA